MEILTSSSLAKFRECPRRFAYEYREKRVPVSESDALGFGSAWHSALEEWWKCVGDRNAKIAAAMIGLKKHSDKIKPAAAAQICALLSHYAPDFTRYEVVAVEQSFEVKIENPELGQRSFYGYRLAGKADLVLRNRETGDTWICDHKTTSQQIIGFDTYWKALQIDGQMSNYCLAFNARGFIYDAVKKPSIKLCGADEKAAVAAGISADAAYQARCEDAITASLDEYYQWREHAKTGDDMAEARRDLWQQVEMFRACDNANRWPRNCGACVGKYGCCPYIDVCCGRADIMDNAQFRTKAETNEELNTEAA